MTLFPSRLRARPSLSPVASAKGDPNTNTNAETTMPQQAQPVKKTAPKKAAATQRPPAKPKPVRLQGATLQLGPDKLAELLFIAFTAKQLADLLRGQSLLIPKDKAVMARRLADHLSDSQRRFDLVLH